MVNEKRLIDANALISNLRTFKGLGAMVAETLVRFTEKQPTVDAVEVVHGEWSTIEDDFCGLVALHCSVCNQEWWFEDDVPIKHYNYCPNCGAKMDGVNDNECS